ncbi:MAG TPA: ATP-binding cassette domain-containing protein, partial [bacterium]|nr:ATP-binding cassette domain-containing protein [bacterium]
MGVPAIRVQDLKYTFPDGTTALQGVSFTVEAGERVAVTGPNGAGKSTLLTLLNGLLAADGAVEIFGVPVIPANLPEIRRRVGLVFQD